MLKSNKGAPISLTYLEAHSCNISQQGYSSGLYFPPHRPQHPPHTTQQPRIPPQHRAPPQDSPYLYCFLKTEQLQSSTRCKAAITTGHTHNASPTTSTNPAVGGAAKACLPTPPTPIPILTLPAQTPCTSPPPLSAKDPHAQRHSGWTQSSTHGSYKPHYPGTGSGWAPQPSPSHPTLRSSAAAVIT